MTSHFSVLEFVARNLRSRAGLLTVALTISTFLMGLALWKVVRLQQLDLSLDHWFAILAVIGLVEMVLTAGLKRTLDRDEPDFEATVQ